MSLAYARKGMLGVLTPQANTTVEPEFSALLPPATAMLTARLVSTRPSLKIGCGLPRSPDASSAARSCD
jgi:maleate isomerase